MFVYFLYWGVEVLYFLVQGGYVFFVWFVCMFVSRKQCWPSHEAWTSGFESVGGLHNLFVYFC